MKFLSLCWFVFTLLHCFLLNAKQIKRENCDCCTIHEFIICNQGYTFFIYTSYITMHSTLVLTRVSNNDVNCAICMCFRTIQYCSTTWVSIFLSFFKVSLNLLYLSVEIALVLVCCNQLNAFWVVNVNVGRFGSCVTFKILFIKEERANLDFYKYGKYLLDSTRVLQLQWVIKYISRDIRKSYLIYCISVY